MSNQKYIPIKSCEYEFAKQGLKTLQETSKLVFRNAPHTNTLQSNNFEIRRQEG